MRLNDIPFDTSRRARLRRASKATPDTGISRPITTRPPRTNHRSTRRPPTNRAHQRRQHSFRNHPKWPLDILCSRVADLSERLLLPVASPPPPDDGIGTSISLRSQTKQALSSEN
ncbi:hypothetical protein M408DRAFT_91980 [Serendipita vermifera MAFF 305830]|uniref:Uncharacterized protein n=1 Tax=Serendipita vermifera MAFF 305830 TaxID=933852 RepID=A0A0C2XZC0_SERVB|nr:hypothetical protein M408DRAFT_91980 [Serendipita vermifera MAFF 305830]